MGNRHDSLQVGIVAMKLWERSMNAGNEEVEFWIRKMDRKGFAFEIMFVQRILLFIN
jgi:hypothetical protein